jgi:squalene-hopene/tetraprenyl-beta-curcumene cyclase
MEESGRSSQNASLKRGVAWLEQHQEKDGYWLSASPNKKRDPESNIGRFMSDAATGYAVMALENAH